ncbi:endonuclease/exonuclease/phosphatase family protein [Marinactinospora rubrisoli]|uniref:Endonuclease/exonuclease/phosphatase family protein n=1 Tax=Marinactinospora rubrisoli TaxID=2715399 RepID=A0ABW2KM82_9ACTN
MPVLRVLSYNVRSLRDDSYAVARVIRGCRPHVVCLQEAPRLLGWRGSRRRLARRAGLTAAVSRRPGGLAVLVRPEVAVVHREHHVLRRLSGLPVRAIAVAVLEAHGRRLAVGCTHLDLDAGARLRHAREALDVLERVATEWGARPVLAGDLNEGPDGPAWRLLATRLADPGAQAGRAAAGTFSARRPRRRIDAVLTAPELTVRRAGVPVELLAAEDVVAASDHRPVLAELEL